MTDICRPGLFMRIGLEKIATNQRPREPSVINSKPFCNVLLPRLPLRSDHPMGGEGCLHSSKATKRNQVASRPAWYAWPCCSTEKEVLMFPQDCRSSAAFGIFRALIAISVLSSGQTSMVRSIRSTSLESIISGWHQTRLHKTF